MAQTAWRIISELEPGFIDEINDVKPFLEANFKALIASISAPHQVVMAQMFALPPAMKFVTEVWDAHRPPETSLWRKRRSRRWRPS